MKDFKNLREREVIATAKLKGDIKYKPLGKFGDRNVIELMIVNGQRKAVAIRDFRRTAIILNIEDMEFDFSTEKWGIKKSKPKSKDSSFGLYLHDYY